MDPRAASREFIGNGAADNTCADDRDVHGKELYA
jgi:hypothetical protein